MTRPEPMSDFVRLAPCSLGRPYFSAMSVMIVRRDEEPFGRQLLKNLEAMFADASIEIIDQRDIADAANKDPSRIDIVVIANGMGNVDDESVLRLRERFPLVPIVFFKTRSGLLGMELKHKLELAGVVVVSYERDKLRRVLLAAIKARVESLKLALHVAATQRARGLDVTTKGGILRLTPQEFRVMLSVREGKPNKVIARDLEITVRTVKAHLTRVFKKMQVSQRSQLIACTTALERGSWAS